MNEKLTELQNAFDQSLKNLTEAFEGLKAEVINVDEPLQKGDKVRFIGPAEEFHEDVTVGKIYEINGFWVNGEPTFLDDLNTLESYSIIDSDARHLFEKVAEPEQVPIVIEQDGPPYAHASAKSKNEQRAGLIEKARRAWQNKCPIEVEDRYNCRPHFKVNHKKRTVTCELRGINTGYVRKRATTRCHPNEVFNEDIGKAISLYMAKEIDVPEEFLNAVQPDGVVVGMEISRKYAGYNGSYERVVKEVVGKEVLYTNGGYDFIPNISEFGFKIINDTNAVYANDAQ